MLLSLSLLLLAQIADGHGLLTYPPNRAGGSLSSGGACGRGECMWFSNIVNVSGEPTLPDFARTIEPDVVGGPADVYRASPWRAPGRAPVFGSGCGAAGGGPHAYSGGGGPPPGVAQGADGLSIAQKEPAQRWQRGAVAKVAWAITANHGGGYSYRICPKSEKVSEECFQKHALRFAGESSWIVFTSGDWKEIARTTVRTPEGGEWARNPVPGCRMCPTYETCGPRVEPGPAPGSDAWQNWSICSAACDGSHVSNEPSCPEGTAQFKEPLPGLSSFENKTWPFSIMDKVRVPGDLELGEYVLSWRWDCEETSQVWQNCADIEVVDGDGAFFV